MKFINLLRSLAIAVAVIGLGLPAQAGMLTTTEIQNPSFAAESAATGSQRDWIELQLQHGGVSRTEANQRVAAMTDAEVARLYQRIDQAPAGGSDVLVIALVVFIVLELTDYIDVIPNR